MLHPSIKVDSNESIEGLGLFATERLPKGTVVWKMVDQAYPRDEIEKWPEQRYQEFLKYGFQYDVDLYVYPEGDSRKMNHSCDPDTWSQGREPTGKRTATRTPYWPSRGCVKNIPASWLRPRAVLARDTSGQVIARVKVPTPGCRQRKVLRDAFPAAVDFTGARWNPTEHAEINATSVSLGNRELREVCHTAGS